MPSEQGQPHLSPSPFLLSRNGCARGWGLFPPIPAPFDILLGALQLLRLYFSCSGGGEEKGGVLQVTSRDQTGQGSGCLFPHTLDLCHSSRAIALPFPTLDFWGATRDPVPKHCSLKRPPGFVTSFLLSPQYPLLCDPFLHCLIFSLSFLRHLFVCWSCSFLSPWCLLRGVLGSLGGSIRLGLCWILGFECLGHCAAFSLGKCCICRLPLNFF